MSGNEPPKEREIPALKVRQWLPDWKKVKWNSEERRSEPQHWFYQFSLSAPDLKALSGIYARSTQERTRGTEDLGIQRRHEPKRSAEIAEFVRYGYPWSELSKAKQESSEFADLRKPGWLPTAIVVNILQEKDERRGAKVTRDDLVHVKEHPNGPVKITLPKGFAGPQWKYQTIPPIEIIDGQHRLWAFEDGNFSDFELPVVAFVGLDLSWQAYLFYIINIKPKKINSSLAFDLYPLLRTEDWLTKFEGHVIYRETRAQELVDLLWSHPQSPWHHRINMLGETGHKGEMVSQSAWINALLATYIKSWEGTNIRIGGLFGSPVGSHQLVLPWSRLEQTAFLIVTGEHLQNAIQQSQQPWAKELRKADISSQSSTDPAFFGRYTLLNQDQGIRAFLYATNDLCYVQADTLSLTSWGSRDGSAADDQAYVTQAIRSLKKQTKIVNFLKELSNALAAYDWRASSAPGLSSDEATFKAAFRGSGGYKELRRHLLRHLAEGRTIVATTAKEVLKKLGY